MSKIRKKYKRAINRKLDVRSRYNAYVNAYNKKKATLAKRNQEMSDEVYDFTTWQETFKVYKRDLTERAKETGAKGIGNVNQYIIADQAYDYDNKTARQLKYALERETGKKFSLYQVRKSENIDWNIIGDTYKELREHYDSKTTKDYISDYFFGS